MANRNESDAREQETLPGPGPGVSPLLRGSGSSGIRPVEQMVDAAIERIARERRAHEQQVPTHGAIERARDVEREGGHELDLAPFESHTNQRAGKPTRLRWKGLDVSEEFRSYAERVARGEDLPPFEGRVLAEPNPAFPWDRDDAQQEGRGSRTLLWCSAAVVVTLLAWSISARLQEPAPIANGAPGAFDVAAEVNGDRGESGSIAANASGADRSSVDSSGSDLSAASVRGHAARAAGGDVHNDGDVPNDGNLAASNARSGGTVPGDDGKAIGAAPGRAAQVEAASAVGAGSSSTPNATAANAAAPAPANAAVARPPVPSAPAKVLPAPTLPTPAALPRASEPTVVKPAVAAAKASQEDEFGILPEGDPTMAAATVAPSTTPSAAKSAPVAGANVGDLARAGQPVSGAVRKEPERESSAKGSLLVETPSF